jgi:hypothetical protein
VPPICTASRSTWRRSETVQIGGICVPPRALGSDARPVSVRPLSRDMPVVERCDERRSGEAVLAGASADDADVLRLGPLLALERRRLERTPGPGAGLGAPRPRPGPRTRRRTAPRSQNWPARAGHLGWAGASARAAAGRECRPRSGDTAGSVWPHSRQTPGSRAMTAPAIDRVLRISASAGGSWRAAAAPVASELASRHRGRCGFGPSSGDGWPRYVRAGSRPGR